jgi:hypothetical protein
MTPRRAIGGKGLNSGIRGGLWEKKHSDAMADAVWLFGWLVLRQTTERNRSRPSRESTHLRGNQRRHRLAEANTPAMDGPTSGPGLRPGQTLGL